MISKRKDGKWTATTDDGRESPPKKTKREAATWLDDQIVDAALGDEGTRLMSAAIVKGLIEKKDGTAYFGSTMSYTHHFERATHFGYVTPDKRVTRRGHEWYTRCLQRLSQKRQVNWTLEGGVGLADASIKD